MPEFKEIFFTPAAIAAWEASPQVSVRAAAIKEFAEREGLSFDAEGMSRVFQFCAQLAQSHGVLSSPREFM